MLRILIACSLLLSACARPDGLRKTGSIDIYEITHSSFSKEKSSAIKHWLLTVKNGDSARPLWDELGYELPGTVILVDRFASNYVRVSVTISGELVVETHSGHNGVCHE